VYRAHGSAQEVKKEVQTWKRSLVDRRTGTCGRDFCRPKWRLYKCPTATNSKVATLICCIFRKNYRTRVSFISSLCHIIAPRWGIMSRITF
jgi:hypothetical protein